MTSVPKRNNGRINDEIPLIKQPHGGALKARGTPGNTGGGRPKDRIKAALTADLEEGLKQLGEALRDNKLTVTEKQRHIEMSLRYTLPVPKAGYDKDLVDRLWEATALVLDQVADGESLAAEIQNGWVPILARKMMANT